MFVRISREKVLDEVPVHVPHLEVGLVDRKVGVVAEGGFPVDHLVVDSGGGNNGSASMV